MSTKLKDQMDKQPKKITLTNDEFGYLNSLDTVGRSFDYYINELKTGFLQTIAMRSGYTSADQLELSIDLKSETHELTINKVTIDKPE